VLEPKKHNPKGGGKTSGSSNIVQQFQVHRFRYTSNELLAHTEWSTSPVGIGQSKNTQDGQTLGKYRSEWRACIAGSTVVDISIPPPFFKPVSLSLPCI